MRMHKVLMGRRPITGLAIITDFYNDIKCANCQVHMMLTVAHKVTPHIIALDHLLEEVT